MSQKKEKKCGALQQHKKVRLRRNDPVLIFFHTRGILFTLHCQTGIIVRVNSRCVAIRKQHLLKKGLQLYRLCHPQMSLHLWGLQPENILPITLNKKKNLITDGLGSIWTMNKQLRHISYFHSTDAYFTRYFGKKKSLRKLWKLMLDIICVEDFLFCSKCFHTTWKFQVEQMKYRYSLLLLWV